MKEKLNNGFLLCILYLMSGCSSNQSKDVKADTDFPIKPLIVFDDKEDGWGADFRLSIIQISENDTAKIYKAASVYNKENLGVLIFIPKTKEDEKGFGKGITLKITGLDSDNLLRLLAHFYKRKLSKNARFIKSISAEYVNLNIFAKSVTGMEDKTNSNSVDYKLFFDAKNDEAQVFLNINESEKWVELREKDPEYRQLLIAVLSM